MADKNTYLLSTSVAYLPAVTPTFTQHQHLTSTFLTGAGNRRRSRQYQSGNQELASSKLQSLNTPVYNHPTRRSKRHTVLLTAVYINRRIFYIIYELWLKSAQNQIVGFSTSPSTTTTDLPAETGTDPAALTHTSSKNSLDSFRMDRASCTVVRRDVLGLRSLTSCLLSSKLVSSGISQSRIYQASHTQRQSVTEGIAAIT